MRLASIGKAIRRQVWGEGPALTGWTHTVLVVALLGVASVLPRTAGVTLVQGDAYSLRFYGHGVGDIDRVKIPIDP